MTNANPTHTAWRDARSEKGMSIDDAIYAWRNREMPDSIKGELSRSKLGRLETTGNAKLTPIAKAHLADLYGQLLSTLDEPAAVEYRQLTQGEPIATCNSVIRAA